MDHFNYRNHELYAEDVAVKDIVEQWGTPCYIYSRATLERHWHAFDKAFQAHPHRICYAVKANSNLALLDLFARLGSSFDIVSQGELERVLAAGGKPSHIIFSGVAKSVAAIHRALEVGIHCFNVESIPELHRINYIAQQRQQVATIAIRVNPNVDPKTHPYISTGMSENKFGIDIKQALDVYQLASQLPHLNIIGIHCHIGSQLLSLSPFLAALESIFELAKQLEQYHIPIKFLNLGGGLGVRYHDETPPEPVDYAAAIFKHSKHCPYAIYLEPGRAIAANAGILVTQVEYLKTTATKHFAIVNAGMNDLLRPALYQGWHRIIPLQQTTTGITQRYDIVGPVCESSDFLAKDRELNLKQGDLLAIRGAGAYGFSMSSQYNSRPRPAEIMVEGDKHHCIRPRESFAELFATERMLDQSHNN